MARLVIYGANLAWEGKAGRGGHVMFALQWIEGLRRLGHEVLYVDESTGNPESLALLRSIMDTWWRPSPYAALSPEGKVLAGVDADGLRRFCRDAAALISLGARYRPEPPPPLAGIRPRVLVDVDPAFVHLWAEQHSPENIYGQHDLYYTIGVNIGKARCRIPTQGLQWRHVWNPVLLGWWGDLQASPAAPITTVAGWWVNDYQVFEGQICGPKAEQFRRFITLPERSGAPFAIALETAPDDPDRALLAAHHWDLLDPAVAVADAHAYRRFIGSSAAEFSCAKGLYVVSQCGWFSDRTACYLAAGRPAICQATGLDEALPSGEGLFFVTNLEEALEAVAAIRADYQHHADAARRIAQEYFASERVIPRFLAEMGVSA